MTTQSGEQLNMYHAYERRFDRAAANLRHPAHVLQPIKTCNNVYEFRFPVRVGRKLAMFTGWRAEPRFVRPCLPRTGQPGRAVTGRSRRRRSGDAGRVRDAR